MAMARACKEMIKRSHGNWKEPDYQFPVIDPASLEPPLTWQKLYEGYVLEARPEPSSQKRQTGVLKALFAFLGHDEPRRVTEDDMIRWKEHCLKQKAAETVRDADIAHPKTLFRWGVENRKLQSDPARNIRVRVPKKTELRDREFTYEEAELVLSWTLVPVAPRISVDRAAAVRWVPWLCHYTGARVNEITPARAQDVYQRRGSRDLDPVWVVNITPDAGSVKPRKAREVAIHPHLIEQEFLEYVKSREGNCLFYEPARHRGGSAGNPLYKKVGEYLGAWVRLTCGVTDPNIGPNHAWRHLFTSACAAADIEDSIVDKIEGHAPATVGRKYGSLWPHVCLERISRLPKFEVAPAREGLQTPGALDGVGSRPRTRRGRRVAA